MAKVCTKCRAEKGENEFSKASKQSRSADGLRQWCKACDRDYRATNKERRALLNRGYYERDPKREYHHSRYVEKREEHSKKMRLWRSQNKERMAELVREWRKNNPERVKAMRHRQPAAMRNANEAARRAVRLSATPSWANKFFIEEIYGLARLRNNAHLGIKHHVDHVVPLNHHLVCGLHVEANLQVIPESVNCSKSNRYWPDMP